MDWFWRTNKKDDPKDPLKDLNPGLREFLKKESPETYESSNPSAAHPKEPIKAPAPPKAEPKPLVPRQSRFQDGRYADLWSQYRPLKEIEAEGKSDNEKVQDVIEAYQHRRSHIGLATLENCAMEQSDLDECYENGGFISRMTLCRAENRKFNRCYEMQSKLLKALGYLSTMDRPDEEDEAIQMRADSIYNRMLAQEKAIEEAKAEGRPAPAFPNIMGELPVPQNKTKPTELKPSAAAGMKKRLEGLEEMERQVEERAIAAEILAAEQVARNLGEVYKEQDEERKLRKSQGRETMGDRVFGFFRAPRPPPKGDW